MVDTSSYIEMLRKFGSDLGLPKMNVDQLVETQKKNIEALGQSAKVAAQVGAIGGAEAARSDRGRVARGDSVRPRVQAARDGLGEFRTADIIRAEGL